jgi:hypothetical protein
MARYRIEQSVDTDWYMVIDTDETEFSLIAYDGTRRECVEWVDEQLRLRETED